MFCVDCKQYISMNPLSPLHLSSENTNLLLLILNYSLTLTAPYLGWYRARVKPGLVINDILVVNYRLFLIWPTDYSSTNHIICDQTTSITRLRSNWLLSSLLMLCSSSFDAKHSVSLSMTLVYFETSPVLVIRGHNWLSVQGLIQISIFQPICFKPGGLWWQVNSGSTCWQFSTELRGGEGGEDCKG